jgi:hypothetical protein
LSDHIAHGTSRLDELIRASHPKENTRWMIHPQTNITTHTVWGRIADGERIFTALRNGVTPRDGDGGYYTIEAALRQKGLR